MKKLKLKVVYGEMYKDGWVEINNKRIKKTDRIVMGTTLDILEHLGYKVELIQSDISKEETPNE